MHVRVNVFEGATSIPEYADGVMFVFKVGSVVQFKDTTIILLITAAKRITKLGPIVYLLLS